MTIPRKAIGPPGRRDRRAPAPPLPAAAASKERTTAVVASKQVFAQLFRAPCSAVPADATGASWRRGR